MHILAPMVGPDSSSSTPGALEALCRRAAGGDGDALTQLLSLHHARLLHFAQRKVGVDWQGKIDPEDLLQEGYIQIFATIAGFQFAGPDSFYYWATRIIDHRFIDQVRHWRRHKRDAAREVALDAGSRAARLVDDCLARVGPPSVALRREETAAAIMSCLARLPEDYREVIHRLYLKQEPLAALAADLGRSEDAIRRLSGRALERLGECLGRASRFLSSHE